MIAALATASLTVGYLTRGVESPVISGLTLSVPAGHLVCVLGPNGAGKSTLLRTLTGAQPPLSGRVEIAGRDIGTYTEHDLARNVSVVLTDRVEAGSMRGEELVSLGRYPHTGRSGRLRPHDVAAVNWAIDVVDARELAGRRLGEVSDGERQRLMLARAIAQEPKLLVLDEPTAYLDLPRRIELIDLLASLAHTTGMAVVMSTHDLDLALRLSDQLWVVGADGQVQSGPPEHLALSGHLTRTFSTATVVIDASSGALRARRRHASGPTVSVWGGGEEATWAAHVAERLGMRITSDSAEIEIETGNSRGSPATGWTVVVGGDRTACADLAEVESVLRRLAGAVDPETAAEGGPRTPPDPRQRSQEKGRR